MVLTANPTSAFQILQRQYAERRAAHADHRANNVIGRIGNTVPTELILAAGCAPLLIAADLRTPTPTAEIYMEPIIPPETKSLFEQLVSGDFEALPLVVLSRPYAQLYYYLKEVVRRGAGRRVPPLHVFDLMQSQRDAVRAYNWARTQELRERLQRTTGTEITEARLRTAIQLTDRVRHLQRDLLERRWRGELSGVAALQAIGASYFMPPDAYADTLARFEPAVSLSGRPKLLVLPSEPLPNTSLHEALEDAGGLVVAEDDWWGSRAPGANIPRTGSALEGIFLKYWSDTATQHVYPAEAREDWFKTHAARPEVDGVVFYLPPSDHQLGWDYPRLTAWLTERGKSSLLVRRDVATPDGKAAVTQQARTWLEALA